MARVFTNGFVSQPINSYCGAHQRCLLILGGDSDTNTEYKSFLYSDVITAISDKMQCDYQRLLLYKNIVYTWL